MTDPSGMNPAGAGLTLVATMLLLGALGLGVGAVLGLPVAFMIAGVFAGLFTGFAIVYTRFRDI
jgi:hypothetical protein